MMYNTNMIKKPNNPSGRTHARKENTLARSTARGVKVDKTGMLRPLIQLKGKNMLTPELIEKCLEYISTVHDVEIHDDKGAVVRIDAGYPNVAGMALYVGVNSKTLYEYVKHSKELRDIFEQLKDTQEDRLLQMGLGGKYDRSIGKLVLMNHHNYKEKADYTQDVSLTDVVKQDRAEFAADDVRY